MAEGINQSINRKVSMEITLQWDGDMAELLDESSGMSLQDNIIFAIENGPVAYHNNIKITKYN